MRCKKIYFLKVILKWNDKNHFEIKNNILIYNKNNYYINNCSIDICY